MGNNLFPVFEIPEDLEEVNLIEQKYKPSPLFDIEKGEFVLNGANNLIYGSGYDGWVLWCLKTIMTERGTCMAYDMSAGIESEEAFSEPDRDAVQSTFERTITEALLDDPLERTQYVKDFDFEWGADSLYITCLAIASDDNSAMLKVKLKN